MRSRLGRRSRVAAALVLTFMVAGPTPPASADTVIARPADGATLTTSSVTVSGRAEAQTALNLPLGTLESVTLRLDGQTITASNCSGVRSCEFSGTFNLPRNGSYSVAVDAVTGGLANAGPPPTRTFSVAAPAAKPVVDPPKVTDSRSVELSWSRNTEPDMLQYEIVRTDPGGAKTPPATVQQPERGTKVTLTDTTTAALEGGTYTYEVRAVRRGATSDSRVFSEASRVVTATVPVLATTTTVGPVPPGAPAGGPTTTVKPAPPAGVDLSGFLSSRSQPIALPPITVPEAPDTGFSGNLPFGARPGEEELEEGEAEAVLPSDGRRSSSVISIDAGRPLVPIAGGLVLLLLALHMRLLGRRVKAAPAGDLPVELAEEPPRAAPQPEPPPVPEARTLLYDVDDEDDDWAEAPEAVEPEDGYDDEDEEDWVEIDPEPEVVEPVALDGDEDDDGWEETSVIVEPLVEQYDHEVWAADEIIVEPDLEPDLEPEPAAEDEPELEPEPVALWGPPEVVDEERPPDDFDPDAIEVVEVVSSSRRRLARAGSR